MKIPLSPRVGGLCIEESSLQPADIIVSTTSAGVSRLIKFATASPVSHAILYSGSGSVIEAISEGVVSRPIGDALAEATLAVAYRHRSLTPALAVKVVSEASSLVGRGYDHGGAIGAGAGSVSVPVCITALGIVGCAAARSGAFDSSDRFFCSELILEAFRRAGVPIANTAPSMSTPETLVDAYSHGKLMYMGHLV